MSKNEKDLRYHEPTEPAIELLLKSDEKDLGEFSVRRTLPSRRRQRVGPFIFFDHMGPVNFAPGTGVSVRPHPHIGLATVTYLFEGEILHRDSLGYVQAIQPGAVNWMIAGRGIVHSERTPPEMIADGSPLHGLQAWVAVPTDQEESDPSFVHYPDGDIPVVERPGVSVRVLAGSAFGETSPVVTSSETLYLAAELAADAELEIPTDATERAVYVASGEIELGETTLETGMLAVLTADAEAGIRALSDAQVMILGGEPLEGKRYIYWNLVSSSRERIDQAKDDWRNDRFDKVPGETEFIPLPE
ncbi:MAG: pirin family protein [Candidatus Rariloculaceae bacterium]